MNLNYTDCVSRTWELNIVVTSRMFLTSSLFTMDKCTQKIMYTKNVSSYILTVLKYIKYN